MVDFGRTVEEVDEVRMSLDADPSSSRYPSMTYEQGVEETLLWIFGEIEDEEFGAISGLRLKA